MGHFKHRIFFQNKYLDMSLGGYILLMFFLNRDRFYTGLTAYYSPAGSAKDRSHEWFHLAKQNLIEEKQTKRHKICIRCADAKCWQIGHQECNNIHILVVLFYSGLLHRLYCNGVLVALQHVFFLFLPCDWNILKKWKRVCLFPDEYFANNVGRSRQVQNWDLLFYIENFRKLFWFLPL